MIERRIITVSFIGVVVESTIDGSVALQMFGDAKTVVLADELVTAWSVFHFGPDGAEALATTHLIGSDEPYIVHHERNSIRLI